jgi:hypothetical protein
LVSSAGIIVAAIDWYVQTSTKGCIANILSASNSIRTIGIVFIKDAIKELVSDIVSTTDSIIAVCIIGSKLTIGYGITNIIGAVYEIIANDIIGSKHAAICIGPGIQWSTNINSTTHKIGAI